MSNYDMDEIERKRSQKQKRQWREYVDKSLEHPLDNRYSNNNGKVIKFIKKKLYGGRL